MIDFEEAFLKVLDHPFDLGNESVALLQSPDRILAEDIEADRDFPPFDRSTKDGIAIHFSGVEKGIDRFKIEGVLSAGAAQKTLSSEENCFEIMTGAVLPKKADTIIMYEETEIGNGWARISKRPVRGQNIHTQGSDAKEGTVLLEKGTKITAAVIGVMATVGKTEVLVKKLPKVCVISTGNELVDISETPLPHQIRKSNTLSLEAALEKVNITPTKLHLKDDRTIIAKELQKALAEHDVLMLSGGVSKGKFDFIPDAMESLGVRKVFHRVAQRPGKPFWFGTRENQKQGDRQKDDGQPENQQGDDQKHDDQKHKTHQHDNRQQGDQQQGHRKIAIFSFPGNPVSTFANYHVYFLPWLAKSLGIATGNRTVVLDDPVLPHPRLTLFLQVKTEWLEGRLHAKLVRGNGSGDLVSLAKADGFIRVPAGDSEISDGNIFGLIPCS